MILVFTIFYFTINLNNNVNKFISNFGAKINGELDDNGFYNLKDGIRLLIFLWEKIPSARQCYDESKISQKSIALFKIMTLFDYTKDDNDFFWKKI